MSTYCWEKPRRRQGLGCLHLPGVAWWKDGLSGPLGARKSLGQVPPTPGLREQPGAGADRQVYFFLALFLFSSLSFFLEMRGLLALRYRWKPTSPSSKGTSPTHSGGSRSLTSLCQ